MAFSRPTLSELITRIEADIVSRLQITSAVLKRSMVRIVARVYAGAAHGLHAHVEWAARQVFASQADDDNLEIHGAELGVTRKVASFATGNVTFTGTNGVGIPAGTRVQRSDRVEYVVTAGGVITAGTATIAVKALLAGTNGNAAAGVAVTLVSPIAGLNNAAVIAVNGITNGIDTESDDAYRSRILQRKRNQPMGGSPADFERWALEVPGVTRAWPFKNYGGAGNIGLTFVLDDQIDIIPDAGKVSEVQAYITDISRSPLQGNFLAFAPTPVPLNFTLQVVPNTQPVKDAVTAELQDLLNREGEPDSTLLLTHITAAISSAAGETNHVLTTPNADQVYTAAQIPVLGVITWV